jgi:predicted outer membrane protein
VKRRLVALLLPLVITGCSTASSPPTTFGVDHAPQLLRNTYLTVTREAATLAGYDATDDQWMEFARTVCTAGLETSQDLADFVDQKAGGKATPDLRQMWTTAATAASTSFCPIG